MLLDYFVGFVVVVCLGLFSFPYKKWIFIFTSFSFNPGIQET